MKLIRKVRICEHGGRGFAEIRDCNLTIQKAFSFYRLNFNFEIKPFDSSTAENDLYLEDLRIDLSYRSGSSTGLLGRLVNRVNQLPMKLKSYERQFVQYLDFPKREFIDFVDETYKQDLEFEFEVFPLYSDYELQSKKEDGRLDIPQSEWLEMINRLDLDRFEFITIRIPVAKSHLHTPFKEATEKIREAEQQYLKGDWNGAAATARSAWRTVLSATPVTTPKTNPFDYLLRNLTGDPRRKDFSKALVKGLHNIQNAAVHLEGDIKTGKLPADLSSQDSLLIIQWYALMIGYISTL